MKLGIDEVLKVPYWNCCFSARSGQLQIMGGAIVGHGGSLSSNLVISAYFNANSLVFRARVVRRPSSVRRPLENSHFQLLQNR